MKAKPEFLSATVHSWSNLLYFPLLLSALTQFKSISATPVAGTILDETWTKEQSPYVVQGNVLVARLLIQPGVSVQFSGNYAFEVAGRLTAIGTKQEPISFGRNTNNSVGWQGIFLNETALPSELAFCHIEGSVNSGIRILNSEPTIRDCVITGNSGPFAGGGIQIKSISNELFVLRRCFISNNVSGGIYIQVIEARVEDCVITDNSFRGVTLSETHAVFQNCDISRNSSQSGGGIYLSDSSSSVELSNCWLKHNTASSGGAIDVGSSSKVALLNCLVLNNTTSQGGAINASSSATVAMTNCTVAFNTNGGLRVNAGGSVVVNSIFWYNTGTQIGGAVTVNYSDIQGNFTGVGNIWQNPIFKNSSTLTLFEDSPCIDAGDPSVIFDDVCFPPSLGTNRNDMGAYGGPGACAWPPMLPGIIAQPRSQIASLGGSVTFEVVATSDTPVSYQWQFQGQDIAGASSPTFTFSNITSNHVGFYTVLVINVAGVTVSVPASLAVEPVLLSINLHPGLLLHGVVGQTYQIQYRTHLQNTNDWTSLTNVLQSLPDLLWVDPEPAASPARFYRVLPAP